MFVFNPNKISEKKLDCLAIPAFIKRNILKYRQSGGVFYDSSSVRRIYGMTDSVFSEIKDYLVFNDKTAYPARTGRTNFETEKPEMIFFDPNIADRNTLVKLGFNDFQVQNMIRYRERGGQFRHKFDMLKIYGVDSVFYAKIKNLIIIDSSMFQDIKVVQTTFKPINLNNADSLTLITLSGIGPVFASRIIKYRNLLGGFYKKEQLLEVYNLKNETYLKVKKQIY